MSEPKFVVFDQYFQEVAQDETEAAAVKSALALAEDDSAYEPPLYVAQIIGKAERSGATYTKLPVKTSSKKAPGK